MKCAHSLFDIEDSLESITLTIGNFDGVHLGHRTLLEQGRRLAQNHSFVVMTFVPHPRQILNPGHHHALINTYEERRELLRDCGVDVLVEVDFGRDFSTLSPEEFLKKFIPVKHVKTLLVGHDFSFGSGKQGTRAFLETYARSHGVQCVCENEFTLEGEVVSSTAIRNFISNGDVMKASQFLGRPFFLRGRVVRGAGRGRVMGFPTANADVGPFSILPALGVYATRTRIQQHVYSSVTSVGRNPTFVQDGRTRIETHLLNFDQDIYGSEIDVAFEQRLRDERSFSSSNELVDQIKADILQAQSILKSS